jgi:hypothetical protein
MKAMKAMKATTPMKARVMKKKAVSLSHIHITEPTSPLYKSFAVFPRAILLTAFFFMTRAFIAVVAFIAFMAFMAFIAFIADFIGRAMLKQKQSIG